MRTITRRLSRGLLVLGCLALPAAAHAEWFAAPFVGVTFGGDTTHKSHAVGVTAGWLGKGWLGFEADLADAPDFFKQDGFLTRRRMTTVMGNAVVSMAHGKDDCMRLFVSGGLGMIRPRLSDAGDLLAVSAKKLGWDVGGGATWRLKSDVGLRGDIRYFHGLRKSDADTNPFDLDFSTFGFLRASVGLNVRF